MSPARSKFRSGTGAIALIACIAPPAAAQTYPIDPSTAPARNQNEGIRDSGRTAESASGEVGERQRTRNAALNAYPLERIPSRLQNRVQNRIRNRIDPSYDPTANTTSPFEAAEERARAVGRARQR